MPWSRCERCGGFRKRVQKMGRDRKGNPRFVCLDCARKKRKKHLAKRHELLRGVLEDGCRECGEKDIRVLTFDHRDPKNKSFDVSRGVHSKSKIDLMAELLKCDVLCANCHAKKNMKGSWRDD